MKKTFLLSTLFLIFFSVFSYADSTNEISLYDPLDQLIENGSTSHVYRYDSIHNRIEKDGNA